MKIIKFQIVSEKNYGTEEKPDLRQVFNDKQCKYTETAYADALKEAYNGEVTVEDIPDTRPLHEIKSERQAENKAALAAWLASHPLTWLDGKRYGVEEQDQNELALNLMQYRRTRPPDSLPCWNGTPKRRSVGRLRSPNIPPYP